MGTPGKVIRELRGFTRPQIIAFDDGDEYVVKFKHALLGTGYIVKEYLAGKLAEALELPIVPFQVSEISKPFIIKHRQLFKNRFKSGTQFCSKYIDGIGLPETPPDRDQVINHKDGPALLVFDAWIGNKDRHRKNILLEERGNEMYYFHLIDHTHVFADLSLPLMNDKVQVHRWCASLAVHPDELRAFSNKIIALPDETYTQILDSIPSDWNVSDRKKNEILEFLNRSRAQLPDKVTELINHYELDAK
ncbi:HipA family kinase [Pseudalkalibacillus sp. SCS-8]|uniref:HipA family kinase n=1 Tax=Pseudalkalibacillus nanhaiensis TaxID=3115291 RepID=UPI0032DA8449